MELRIHYKDLSKIVSGVCVETTVREIIMALTNCLKITGRFYLIEHSNDGIINKTRLMDPTEKLLQLIDKNSKFLDKPINKFDYYLYKSVYSNNETNEKLIENEINQILSSFKSDNQKNLFYSSITSSSKKNVFFNNSNMSTASSKYDEIISSSISESDKGLKSENKDPMSYPSSSTDLINIKQLKQDNQSSKLNHVFKKIEIQEIDHINLYEENEYFKSKLSDLEKLNDINVRKLEELDKETRQLFRIEEKELNEILTVERDNLEKNISHIQSVIDNKILQESSLKKQIELLNIDILKKSKIVEEDQLICVNDKIKETIRIFDLNNAKLNFLEYAILNLENLSNEKHHLIKLMETQLEHQTGNKNDSTNMQKNKDNINENNDFNNNNKNVFKVSSCEMVDCSETNLYNELSSSSSSSSISSISSPQNASVVNSFLLNQVKSKINRREIIKNKSKAKKELQKKLETIHYF